jgi:CheY-like chemotaxis protein
MNKTVLIVEDNERNRKLVRTVLEFRGYLPIESIDGEGALPLALEHLPALVLMDIRLPGIDGIEALRRLRGDPRTAGIPVVAVTASVTPGERDKVLAAGFNAYLGKPIDIAAFTELVDQLVVPGAAKP